MAFRSEISDRRAARRSPQAIHRSSRIEPGRRNNPRGRPRHRRHRRRNRLPSGPKSQGGPGLQSRQTSGDGGVGGDGDEERQGVESEDRPRAAEGKTERLTEKLTMPISLDYRSPESTPET